MSTEKQPYAWKSFKEQVPEFDKPFYFYAPDNRRPVHAMLSSRLCGIITQNTLSGECLQLNPYTKHLVFWTYSNLPSHNTNRPVPQEAIDALNERLANLTDVRTVDINGHVSKAETTLIQ
jgi:hypothetical protein